MPTSLLQGHRHALYYTFYYRERERERRGRRHALYYTFYYREREKENQRERGEGVGMRCTTFFTTLFTTWGALNGRSRRFCWAPAWFYYRGRTADMLFTEGSALLTCFLLQGAHCSGAADDSVGHRHVHLHPPGVGGLVSAWRFS